MPDKWTDGDAYERYVGRWSRRVAPRFLAWLEAPSGARWLDLGSGTGALTAQILGDCAPKSILGVEPSEGFLKLARQQVTDSRATFVQGAGDRIPSGDGSVDVAVAGLVMNFIPDPSKAMAELSRCIAPGGKIAAYVWDYAGHMQLMRHFWDAAVALNPAARDKVESTRFPLCRPGPLRLLFESAGLRDVSVDALDIPTPFANFNDYWEPFLSGVAPAPGYCMSLDEASRNALKTRLQKALPTDEDGMILLAARAWAVKGRRA